MTPHTDDLVVRAVAGDADALSELLRRHGPVILPQLQIGRPWRSMIDPEDVMQVTYMEAFIQIGRFDLSRGTSFAAWLGQIAENNLKDAIRGLSRAKQPQPERRVQVPAGADSFIGLFDLLGATSATPSREVGREEIQGLLEAALLRLPDDYAKVIRLYDLEGRSIADVAGELKRSAGAVHMLRARAHDRLRELLGPASVFFSTPA